MEFLPRRVALLDELGAWLGCKHVSMCKRQVQNASIFIGPSLEWSRHIFSSWCLNVFEEWSRVWNQCNVCIYIHIHVDTYVFQSTLYYCSIVVSIIVFLNRYYYMPYIYIYTCKIWRIHQHLYLSVSIRSMLFFKDVGLEVWRIAAPAVSLRWLPDWGRKDCHGAVLWKVSNPMRCWT